MFFFFNDTATTEIYTLSLHDALPISQQRLQLLARVAGELAEALDPVQALAAVLPILVPQVADLAIASVLEDRKSTRLNSSHANISYAVFCLKKKLQLTSVH